ncbi:hypothetical protein V496_09330, partial [Pseudogymnoascus sp. VKM F-4515 (FW-2607)]
DLPVGTTTATPANAELANRSARRSLLALPRSTPSQVTIWSASWLPGSFHRN